MRQSPLLKTPIGNLLFMLASLVGYGFTAVYLQWLDEGAGILTLRGVVGAICAGALGPKLIRYILSRRIFILLSLALLVIVEPFLALVFTLLVSTALLLIWVFYRHSWSFVPSFFGYSDTPWSRRVLYTFGGCVLLLAALTSPFMPIDLAKLCLKLSSDLYIGFTTIVGLSLCGYFIGNSYFPHIVSSKLAMLSLMTAMLIINPLVGGFVMVLLLFFVLVLCFVDLMFSKKRTSVLKKRRSKVEQNFHSLHEAQMNPNDARYIHNHVASNSIFNSDQN